LGYGDDERSAQMRQFFSLANKQALEELSKALKDARSGERP
jgi:hypothetical protein